MKLNKQSLQLLGITESEYKNWCRENHKAAYKQSTKEDFFARLEDGRLIRDSSTGKLVKKYRKRS